MLQRIAEIKLIQLLRAFALWIRKYHSIFVFTIFINKQTPSKLIMLVRWFGRRIRMGPKIGTDERNFWFQKNLKF